MRVRDLNLNPSADFEGFVTADDMVLAIDISAEKNASVDDYAVVQMGISGVDPSLNSETKDTQYIRSGKSSTKTGTQRQFSISGDMYIGDEAQNFLLSHQIKYGTGQTVVVPYAYFNMLTGHGETGTATIAVNSDGSGNSGDNAGIDIQLSKIGSAPTEFTYTRTAAATPDCTLSSLSLGTLTLSPEFNSATTAYTATTSNNTNTITAAATATSATIAIKVGETVVENGSAATWANGENTVTITVTNGSASKVYTVTVTKE